MFSYETFIVINKKPAVDEISEETCVLFEKFLKNNAYVLDFSSQW